MLVLQYLQSSTASIWTFLILILQTPITLLTCYTKGKPHTLPEVRRAKSFENHTYLQYIQSATHGKIGDVPQYFYQTGAVHHHSYTIFSSIIQFKVHVHDNNTCMYNKQFTIGHFTNSYLQGVKMVKINVDEYFLCTGYKLVRIQNTLDY